MMRAHMDGKNLGKYTKYDCKRIDAKIDSQLHSITDAILESISGVKSIVLTGGFGKGEGSVEIRGDGKVAFVHDLDLAVIIDRIPREKTVQELYEQIYGSFGLTNPEHKLFRASSFVVDIKFLRKKDLIYPDIWFYDLKAASQLLYGEEVRNLVPWGKKDIPLSSGLRILFERVLLCSETSLIPT